MREVFYKRFLGGGFYVKREGDSYWLGHARQDGISRIRITKEIYQGLLDQGKALRKVP